MWRPTQAGKVHRFLDASRWRFRGRRRGRSCRQSRPLPGNRRKSASHVPCSYRRQRHPPDRQRRIRHKRYIPRPRGSAQRCRWQCEECLRDRHQRTWRMRCRPTATAATRRAAGAGRARGGGCHGADHVGKWWPVSTCPFSAPLDPVARTRADTSTPKSHSRRRRRRPRRARYRKPESGSRSVPFVAVARAAWNQVRLLVDQTSLPSRLHIWFSSILQPEFESNKSVIKNSTLECPQHENAGATGVTSLDFCYATRQTLRWR